MLGVFATKDTVAPRATSWSALLVRILWTATATKLGVIARVAGSATTPRESAPATLASMELVARSKLLLLNKKKQAVQYKFDDQRKIM